MDPGECVERCEVMGQLMKWSDSNVGVVEISRELEIGVIMPLFLPEERLLEYVFLGVMMVSKEYFLKEQNKHELALQYKL